MGISGGSNVPKFRAKCGYWGGVGGDVSMGLQEEPVDLGAALEATEGWLEGWV